MANKACKKCKSIVESGSTCPQCGNDEFSDTFKGKLVVLKPEESEIAKNIKIGKKGIYAVKLG